MKNVLFINVIFVLIIILISCNEKEKEFYLYSDLINNQTYINRIDTFTCKSYSIILDSFPTSGYEKMLVGYFSDSIIGSITCKSVFQIGLPSTYPSENDELDSASMFLSLDGYSYGDTTKICKYELYSLTDFPEKDEDEYYYNSELLKYGNKIGERELLIYPNIIKEISIPVRKDFSESLLMGLISGNEYFQSNEEFLKFLPGIVLVSDTFKTHSILRFLVSSDNVYLRLFLRKKELMNETYYIDFPLINTTSQFNIISRNFLHQLSYNNENENKIASEKTNYTSFINSGCGIFTRIDFPYINDLFSFGNFRVLKAILTFKPQILYTNIFELSDSLICGRIGYDNKIQSVFYDSDGNYIMPSLSVDELYNLDTRYTIDVTSFINSGISNKWFNPDEGLFLFFHPDYQYKSFKNLCIDAKSLQLIIYILKY